MSLLVQRRVKSEIGVNHVEPELAIRLTGYEGQVWQATLAAAGDDEEWVVCFDPCRVGVRSPGGRIEGEAKVVVSWRRLIAVVWSSGLNNSPGLNDAKGELAFVAVSRSDLGEPVVRRGMFGKVKRVEFQGLDEPFTLEVPFVRNFERFLEVMGPAYAAELHDTERNEREAAERAQEAASAVQAAEEQAAEQVRRDAEEQRRRNAERFADGGPASGPGLGSLFDHRRTWRYRTTASPEACVEAFVEAFSTGGGIVARAKWDIERTPDGAVATYAGRKGAIGLVSALSATAQAEEEGALGSEVRCEVEERAEDHTIFAMWLAVHSSRAGFVNDGRFIRPYMRAVESHLRRLDPGVRVVKD